MVTHEMNPEELNKITHLFRILGHPKRLEILYILIQGGMSVTDISKILKRDQSTVSHQLQILRENGLVKYVRHGRNNIYHLQDPTLMTLIADMMNLNKGDK